ncbi:hypothetical protein EV643_103304 [Kribbella sp. VKM Ac-2527]|uniref:Uncharacterized protein n=1 Tax=Kribbella caucasensis TaxID=2512215 RepID=A0A4R6KMD8_9ACTN|nr:hypothetical protein [Kribbella sp. VKM Ac-2527]TDO51565.1 hypothetical protein EV643_103304 [Kribbella sp. VKM Ac-2527]
MRPDDFADANRLLRFSVDRSSRPGSDLAHRALLERFRTDPGYASAVRFAAEPLGLRVLGADPQVGLILDAAADSPFSLRSDDLAREFKWTSAAERITYGVAFVGIATYCYPTASSFGESGTRQVTAVEVDEWIRKAATAAQSDSTAAGDEIATADALAVYVAEKSISRNKGSSALRQDCTVYRIGRVLRWLAEQQFMVRDATKPDVFRSTERFRLHVREVAAKAVFDAVRSAATEEDD